MKSIFLSIVFMLIILSPVLATDVYFFESIGCPFCEKMAIFLDELSKEHPEINISKYEVRFNEDNRELFMNLAKGYGFEIEGVPVVFINDKYFEGYAENITKDIKSEVEFCATNECISPSEKLSSSQSSLLTIPAVISAAAVDAINPCAFAVLIILVTKMLIAGNKKRALLAGLAFSLAVFISYYLMGVGLFSAIQTFGLTHIFYIVVSILAIIVGLFNLKDYLWYGKWFVMEVPLSWRPRLNRLVKSVTSVPGAFLIGILVSLFLLPCTSGPYIVILGLLAKSTTRDIALWYLVLYNLIFILPMIAITLLIYFGITSTEKLENWRLRKLKILHLIAGIIILCLGIGMILAVIFGWI